MNLEKTLRKIGFSGSTYLETVVVLFRGSEVVNIVPLGFVLKKGTLMARVFRGSKTYKLVAEGAVNRGRLCITRDAMLFYLSIFKKEEALKAFNRLCSAYVDFDIAKVEPRKTHLVLYCRPAGVEIIDRVPKGFIRASAAIIEALVWLSKIPYTDKSRRSLYEDYVRMCISIVYRSSRSRRYRAIAQDISRYLHNLAQHLN